MSHTPPTTGHPFHRSALPSNPAVRVTPTTMSPEIVVGGVPHLLGFCPEESLIIIAFDAQGAHPIVATLRVDLPAIDEVEDRAALVAGLHEPLTAIGGRCDSMMVIVWTHGSAQSDGQLIDDIADLIESMGTVVADGLVVNPGGRSIGDSNVHSSVDEDSELVWRSVWCHAASCCGITGNRLNVQHRRSAARLLARGRTQPADSRSALVQELDGVESRQSWTDPVAGICPDAFEVAVVHAVIHLRSGIIAQEQDRILLAQALCDIRVRDTVLWEILTYEPDEWRNAVAVLAQLVRTAAECFVAPLATCLAVLNWQLGDGARAMVAVERALRADKEYSLARLIGGCVGAGLHPTEWRNELHRIARRDLNRP